MTPRLIIMVKAPVPGRVKTRLGRDFGYVRAAWWYRHQTFKTIRTLRDRRWEIVLAVSPDSYACSRNVWPQDLKRIAQGRGNLGNRMRRLLKTSGPRRTCIIGSDIPNISKADIAASFAGLGSNNAVIGPCDDGGYWLIGTRSSSELKSGLFEGVRWSTPYALHDTIASAPELSWHLASSLSDVDTLDDLKAHLANR